MALSDVRLSWGGLPVGQASGHWVAHQRLGSPEPQIASLDAVCSLP